MIFAENLGVPWGPVALDDGSWLETEMEPERGCGSLPTNVAFGLDEQKVYVTEYGFDRVETLKVGTGGSRLYA